MRAVGSQLEKKSGHDFLLEIEEYEMHLNVIQCSMRCTIQYKKTIIKVIAQYTFPSEAR